MKMFFESKDRILNKAYRRQLLATLTLNIITFSHGIGTGIVSPTLLHMQSDNSPYTFGITVSQASWIGSLVSIGGMIGNIAFSCLKERIGRKKAVYLIAVPQICLWLALFFARNVYHLYIARILGGIAGGGVFVVIPIYISEIADCRIRGTLSSFLIFSVNCGILTGFIVASHVYFFIIPCVIIILPILYILLWIKYPETPPHLIRKGFYAEAENSMKFYKNYQESTRESYREFSSEFNDLIKSIQATKSKQTGSLRDFCNKSSLKALTIAVTLVFVFTGSGTFTLLNYLSMIFKEAGSTSRILTYTMLYSESDLQIDPNTHTIVIGVVQIAGSWCATILVDKYGRKILLMVSSGGMCLGLTAIGLYSYLRLHNNFPRVTWLPPLLMSFVVFIANIGVLAVTFVTVIEVLPPNIRTLGTSFCMFLLSLFSFVILKTFPIVMFFVGLSGALWMCAGIAGYGFLFFLNFLHETKGMSLHDSNDYD